MKELKERYFCGIDFTKRSEYRDYILRLEAENEYLKEEKQTAIDEKHAWYTKFMEQKQKCESLQRTVADNAEQVANLRVKLAIADENERNTKSYIEGLKKEREAALDKVECLEGKLKRLTEASKEAAEIAEKVQRDSEIQAKAYMELAHDYDILKEDYDNLRVSVAINNAVEPYVNSIVEACEGRCSCGDCQPDDTESWKEADQTHEGSDEVWHEGEVIKAADMVPVAIQDTEGESVIVEEVAEQPKKNSSKRRKKRPKKNNE